MAADQRRKRMSSANVIGFSSREHYRAKRKKLGSPPEGAALRLRDHISLEWDGNRSKVVSKREQVGISSRHLREFVDFVSPKRRSLLALVCPAPREIFHLENLSGVLSTEVWRSCLSDDERNYLQQFLPEGIDVEQVVEQLLNGENFHFGNPFLDWGTNVCSGKAHPDQIVSQEECLKAAKSRYYEDLEKYHNDIIDSLLMLKEKWESCKDPEKDAVKMWGRSREGNAHVNGSCHDLTAASESSSGDADDKPCNSDRSGEVQRRPKSSAVERENFQSRLIASENAVNVGVKARKNDKLPKHSIQQTDGAKYMSYLKISKKQHQIVTSMKQSGKSIQLKALDRILGNINNLDVQPYGLFVEEEEKKLNAHWLQLVRDLPAAYAIWKKLQSQKRDVINSVERELKDKLNPLMECHDVQLDLRRNDPESLNPNQSGDDLAPDDEDTGDHSHSEDSSSDVDQIPGSGRCLQVGTYPSQVSSPDCDNANLADIEEKRYSSPSRYHPLNRMDVEANDNSSSMQSQSLLQASLPSESHPSDLEDAIPAGKNCVPEVEKASSSHEEELQFPSGGDVWQPVGGIRQSYTGRQAYTPSGGLSIIHHHPEGGEEEKNGFIHLEEVDGRTMLQRKANNSFGSFPNNNQNELLQSLFKGQAGRKQQQSDGEESISWSVPASDDCTTGTVSGPAKTS
ncbi:Nuclear factor kappa-B-binding protein [Hirschfeldia incana]|nr:Nuclear factor kappa-B-binding protein [Hirschfeldia incana]